MKVISKKKMFGEMEQFASASFFDAEEAIKRSDQIFGWAADALRDEYGEIDYNFYPGDAFLQEWGDWYRKL